MSTIHAPPPLTTIPQSQRPFPLTPATRTLEARGVNGKMLLQIRFNGSLHVTELPPELDVLLLDGVPIVVGQAEKMRSITITAPGEAVLNR